MEDNPQPEENKEDKAEKVEEAAPVDTPPEASRPIATTEPLPEVPAAVPDKAPEAVIQVQSKKKSKLAFLRPENIFTPKIRNKLGKKARPLASVIIACLLIGIGGLIYWMQSGSQPPVPTLTSSFKLPTPIFQIVSTVPANNDANVSTSTNLTLNFNEPVNAAKMINNMFITPTLTGTFKQGSNKDQIVFTPSTPFTEGTKYSIMINGTYESSQGSKLGEAYEYNFTTLIPNNAIDFIDQNEDSLDQIDSLPSGQKATFSLDIGSTVGSGASVTLYQGDINDLLNSLVYAPVNSGAYSYPAFSNLAVPTTGLQKVSSVSNVTNNQNYVVQQPDGIYLAVANNSSGQEVGFVWVVFSNFGVILRQDDQKVVLDAQSFSSSQDVAANVSFYNLSSSVNLLSQQSVDGLTTVNFPYSPSVDVAVATYNGETAIVPINILDSGGDIRVDQDLSTAQQVYGITDKPTYSVNDEVQYAGFVRTDDDAQYVNPGTGTVNLYVAQYKGGTPLASFTASIDQNGMFSGSITPSSSWLNSGDAFDQFQIFASAVDGNSNNDIPVASFTLSSQSNASSNITVQFSQASYTPNNTITATITATNASGQPLANTSVQVHTLSEDYYENDPASNLANFGYSGNELPSSPTTLQLNSSGQATYTLNPASLPNDGQSQYVTVQANLPGQSGVGAAGGASAIIHQGDGILKFGVARQAVPSGSDLISPIYATDLSGNPLASKTINYKLVDIGSSSSTALATGSVTTNSTGYAEIDIPASQLATNGDSMEMQVSMQDQYGNTINSSNDYSVADSKYEIYDTSGAALQDLNVTGSSGNVSVGDIVDLTINSPASIRALVTMDRGRIYSPSMVSLNAGNNNYSFTVAADLAPSFTLTFSYFLNGIYHSEGVAFNVSEASQAANVTISPASQTVTAGQPTTVNLSTTDSSGQPLPTSMIVEVESANAYQLSAQVNPSIFNTLYDPRPIMTSSSSSLSFIGSGGGGRCGGGGGDLSGFVSAIGTTLDWQPEVDTNSSGNASITFTPPSGAWVISAYAMSGNTQVGSQSTTITAQ